MVLQSIPDGMLVTVAVPVPVSCTVNVAVDCPTTSIFVTNASSQGTVTLFTLQLPLPPKTVWKGWLLVQSKIQIVGKLEEFVSPVT